MAATPKNGTFTLRNRAGLTSSVDVYISDVSAAAATFSKQGSAGSSSPQFVTFGEDMVLIDYAMITGTADTVSITPVLDDSRTNVVLRYANYLNSLATRPPIGLVIKAGQRLGAIQNA